MRNIALLVSYDGSEFNGWQVQPNALTVQEVLENAIFKLTSEKVRLTASGRTDAGAHAIHQVVNFFTCSLIPLKGFVYGLRKFLPDSVSVKDAKEVDLNFNSRKSAVFREYVYLINDNPGSLFRVFLRKRIMFSKYEIDVELWKEAVKHLLGENDFSPFTSSDSTVKTRVRRVLRASVERFGEFIVFRISATGFLKGMIRSIVGTLFKAQKMGNPRFIEDVLRSRDRSMVGKTVEPDGLYLWYVHYPKGLFSEWKMHNIDSLLPFVFHKPDGG